MQTDKLNDIAWRVRMNCSISNFPFNHQSYEIKDSIKELNDSKKNAEIDLIKQKLLGDTEEQEAYIKCLDALIEDAEYKLRILKQARKVQLHESRFKLISACLNAVSIGIILGTIFTKVIPL